MSRWVRVRYKGVVLEWFIRHAMRALYPRTEALPGVEDTDDVAFVRRFREDSTTLMWAGLLLATFVFVSTPLLTVFLPVPSFLLPRRLLDRHASRITTIPIYLIRQAVFLLKLQAGLCWGQHAKVRAKMAMAPYPADPDTWRTGSEVGLEGGDRPVEIPAARY
ncbi:MAG: hypothetical protein AB7S26_17115 [Sandaracinaceae bacterium]